MSSIIKAFSDVFTSILELFTSLIRSIFSGIQSIFAVLGTALNDVLKLFGGLIEFVLRNIVPICVVTVAFVYIIYSQRQGKRVAAAKKTG